MFIEKNYFHRTFFLEDGLIEAKKKKISHSGMNVTIQKLSLSFKLFINFLSPLLTYRD
jgi:hypothetical protein